MLLVGTCQSFLQQSTVAVPALRGARPSSMSLPEPDEPGPELVAVITLHTLEVAGRPYLARLEHPPRMGRDTRTRVVVLRLARVIGQ